MGSTSWTATAASVARRSAERSPRAPDDGEAEAAHEALVHAPADPIDRVLGEAAEREHRQVAGAQREQQLDAAQMEAEEGHLRVTVARVIGKGVVDDVLGDLKEEPGRRQRQDGEEHETDLQPRRRTHDVCLQRHRAGLRGTWPPRGARGRGGRGHRSPLADTIPSGGGPAQARPGREPSGPGRRHDEDHHGDEVDPPVGVGVVEAQRPVDEVVDDRRGEQRVLLATDSGFYAGRGQGQPGSRLPSDGPGGLHPHGPLIARGGARPDTGPKALYRPLRALGARSRFGRAMAALRGSPAVAAPGCRRPGALSQAADRPHRFPTRARRRRRRGRRPTRRGGARRAFRRGKPPRAPCGCAGPRR